MKINHNINITVKSPTSNDAQALASYMNIIAKESDQLLISDGEIEFNEANELAYIQQLQKQPNSILKIVTFNRQIIGVGSIQGKSLKKTQHRGEVGISVRKKYWNLGVGSAIMRALIESAKDNDHLEQLELIVRKDNTHAIRMYQNFDFQTIGTFKNAIKIQGKSYDALHMVCFL